MPSVVAVCSLNNSLTVTKHKVQVKYFTIITTDNSYFLTLQLMSGLGYVEIKCQLDATDVFLLQISLLAQHVLGTITPIIRSSRVLYRWLLHVVFSALVFKLSVWCGAEGYVLQQPANRTHSGARNMLSKQ